MNALKAAFKISAGEMKTVANIFNLAKQDVTGYEAYAEELAAILLSVGFGRRPFFRRVKFPSICDDPATALAVRA